MSERSLEERLARWVAARESGDPPLDPAELCEDAPDLEHTLRALIEDYERVETLIAGGHVAARPPARSAPGAAPELPRFEGFRTIERLGGGGGGEVFKLEDEQLGRIVAGKIVRPEGALRANLDDFVREARAQALFDDPRIVGVLELRSRSDPPLLVMEYVEGFELGRIGSSLEYAQRARVMEQIAEALEHAHRRGMQHRDLKPSNVMLDDKLAPRILDFGLSRGEAHRGHGVGTLAYMAPEQLDPSRPIDARSDVYAMGVMLYELLCGRRPYDGADVDAVTRAIRAGSPRLPVEVEPDVPEPLQAIALKAMERDPAARYASGGELAAELRRYLDGRPVLARPTLYQSALERRVGPHLAQIREWRRINLIHPHEEERLRRSYQALRVGDEDWIVRSRSLTWSHIALYIGALLIAAGGMLYFGAYLLEAVSGLTLPTLTLALPFVALNLAAHRLRLGGRPAVAMAFRLAAVPLLPMYLLIVFGELGLWPAGADDPNELLGEGFSSNRQLQLATLAAATWAALQARRTRTLVLAGAFVALVCLLYLTLLLDAGLVPWIEDGAWHRLAAGLTPLLALLAALGVVAERRTSPWLAQPAYLAGALVLIAVPELWALDGRAFALLGLSMAPFQPAAVSDPLLLDTLAAMTVNGLLVYVAASALARFGSPLQRDASWLLFVVSPFALLQPLAWLSAVGEYSSRYDWIYLVLALAVAALSRHRQRKSFYYAGLLNTLGALWLITAHQDWFDRPAWAVAVGLCGLLLLAAGVALHARERRSAGPL